MLFSLISLALCVLAFTPTPASGEIGVELPAEVPGWFDPDEDLRAPKPYRAFGRDSLAQFNHEALIFRVETELDSARGFYVSTRKLFGRPYGRPIVESREHYREFRFRRDRRQALIEAFREEIVRPTKTSGSDAIEIQVPFKIKSKTFRRIFGGDRVGLRVSGKITVDGGLRREKSDEVITTRNDQANYNFKIDQTQQFKIVGKVGDKVSVEIDQDSERVFDFENNVRLEYQGYEDEIIQSIEAGNVSLTLPGTQLATLTAKNEGLFGFKTISKVGPLSITTIASLQKGEKNKLTYTGGSESQTYQVDDRDYMRDQYFFIDPQFRENYPHFTRDYDRIAAPSTVERIEVYRSQQGADVSTLFEGWALFDETYAASGYVRDVTGASADEIAELVQSFDDDADLQSEEWAERAFYKRLEEGVDYEYQQNLGWIRLKYPAQTNEVIAVAYVLRNEDGSSTQVGTISPPGNTVILKLLKPKNPRPNNPTWDLSWKHVYWVGTTGLKSGDFNFRLARNNTDRTQTNVKGTSWLEVFGMDVFNTDGQRTPDGQVDDLFVRYNHGEIHFPDLRPFDPAGYTVGGEEKTTTGLDSTLWNPDIYDVLPNSGTTIEKNFILESEYSNTSANINLGINVLEGSEEVYLNGALLQKGEDYIIDYLSGQITILNQQAFDANANLEIKYESGEVFQLDRRTMLGVRLEYALWEDSFVGLTLLNFNEKPIEERVKVGNEPLQNFVWDANTRLRFHPYFMTQAVNALPLISTDEPSSIEFEGEIAQVFPNPNSLNNEATGDDDGVAYIDDFEAAQRATPLGVRRKNWHWASHPLRLPSGESRSTIYDDWDVRGRLFWYNPFSQVPIKDIWPNREVNSKVPNNTDVLVMEYDPQTNSLRKGDLDPKKAWSGVMRALSPGFHNQSNTKFLEVWMKWTGGGPDATIYFDMGQISEDVIPNNKLDTEDNPLFSDSNIGNEILDDGEDIGLDGLGGPDPPWRVGGQRSGDPWLVDEQGYDYESGQYDWWDLNGNGVHDEGVVGDPNNPPEPFSTDNWSFDLGAKNYERINGTEGNRDDEARYPDTEDLDGDRNLTWANNFFRYQFEMNDIEDHTKYIKGGQGNQKGWRLVRIPIDDIYDEVNRPDLTQIEYFRIWMGDFETYGRIEIAQIELVGNEWLEDPVVNPATGDTATYVTASTINTYDNPEDYEPPPGVAGEIDPITDIRSKEQSLVINVEDMPSATEGQLIKYLYNPQDLREYRQLKMFVHGGGRNPQNLAGKDLEFFLRFGSGVEGANRGYYEYSLPLEQGWADNEIVVNIDRLTRMKKLADESGEGFAYETLANGDVIKVIGDPTIGSVNMYAVGVRNSGRPVRADENIEIWVDEMRLSGVRKERGMAMRSSLDLTFADFLELKTNMKQSDAEFHQVDQRSGSDRSSIEATVSGSLKLDKFLDPALGIQLPVRGSVSSDLDIPKYTSSNGDVRTESLVEQGELNVWKRFAEMALTRDHLEDKYLRDDQGNILVDEETGVPVQDREKWGVDTLFTTGQNYSWSVNFSKNRESGHWLPKYTVDHITASYNHAETYSSSLSYQFQKTFTNRGNIDYSLPIREKEVPVFEWAEGIPVLGDLIADNKFNYLPTRIKLGIDATESKKSKKHRNALELPYYNLSLTRDFGTGYKPFRPISFDFDYSVSSQLVREDSTRQQILYDDQPAPVRGRYFEPNTPPITIIEQTIDTLETNPDYSQEEQPSIADRARARLDRGDDPDEIVEWLFDEIETTFGPDAIRQPWEKIAEDDPRYQSHFWSALNMPFADVQKTQNVRFNYNPNLFQWLTAGFDYTSRYTWNWSNFKYTGRQISTNNSLGANMTFRVRQILPQESGKTQQDRARDFARMLGQDLPGKGKQEEEQDKEETEEEEKTEEEKVRERQKEILRAINPVNLALGFLRKLQDIRFNYTQSTSFTNPAVEDGTPSWEYRLGFTGDPGLDQVPNQTSVASANRTDDYRINTGIDWSTRLNTTLDYNIKFTKSSGNKTSGSHSRSALFLYDEGEKAVHTYDIPNYQVRWTGLEQFGPLEQLAQAVTFDHSYRGEYSERWDYVIKPDSLGGPQREVQSRSYDRSYSPLAGFNITWKHGISTNIRYTWSQRLSETASNNTRTRDTNAGISVQANYTRETGFRIPIPIWPFKNKRFENETTFSLTFDRTTTLKETQREGTGFETTNKQLNWSISPSVNYRFSRNVNGSIRYKYGVTETVTNTTRFQEFGINISITIRG